MRAVVTAVVLLGMGMGVARAQDLGQGMAPPPAESAPAPAPALTKAPAVVKAVEPVYPPEALASGLTADVTMTVDLDAAGQVAAVSVAQPAGRGFDEAARAAMLQYLFSPAEIDGHPAPIRIAYTLHFRPRLAPAGPAAEIEAPPVAKPPPPVVVASGRIREKGTRDPLAGVELSVIPRTAEGVELPAVAGGATDQEGRFTIQGRRGVAFRIVATEPRHQACVRDVSAADARADKPALVECLVARQLGTSYETTVRTPPPVRP